MSAAYDHAGRENGPYFKNIARRIGLRLRDVYETPESEPLPTEHVDLLLRLRHKERAGLRRGA